MKYKSDELAKSYKDETMFLKIDRGQLLEPTPIIQPDQVPKKLAVVATVVAKKVESTGMLHSEFLEGVYDAAILTDRAGKVLDCNTRASEFFLLDHDHMCRLKVTGLLAGADDTVLCAIVTNLDNDRRTVIEADCIRSDGTSFPSEITVNLVHLTEHGELSFFIRNVTRRREIVNALRESEQRFRDIAESTSDWIWEINKEGVYTFCTEKATEVLGYPVQELLGKSLFESAMADHRKEAWEIFNGYVERHQNLGQLEVWMFSVDGTLHCVSFSGCPVFNEAKKCIGYRGIASDVTDRKKKEEELDRYRHRLEELVRERTAELVGAKEEAEAANRAKSDFLANMSHELRTPMHGILSFANFGITRIDRSDKGELLDFFQEIKDSGERLLHLLDDLLDLAKLEAGKMTYEKIDLELFAVVDSAVSQFQSLITEKNLNITLDKPDFSTVCEIDQNRIIQVMSNLMSNAIKFTPEGKTIQIRCRQGSIKRGRLPQPSIEVSFYDEGVGVPEDELNQIFNKFTQSGKTHTAVGGTGLGLAICREIIVTGHGGLIWAENNPDGGVVLTTSLPLKSTVKIKAANTL